MRPAARRGTLALVEQVRALGDGARATLDVRDDLVQRAIHLTINGVATALRNSG